MRALLFAAVFASASPAFAFTQFFVTNTNDSGSGSFRQAILDANATPNGGLGGADYIFFAVTPNGFQTLALTSALPAITEQVTIDAGQQPGVGVGFPGIGLTAAAIGDTGLLVNASGTTISGLSITGFATGIDINAANVTVTDCFIGLDGTGTTKKANSVGINVRNTGTNVHIGVTRVSNVISGNFIGILVAGGTGQIQGNIIGLDRTGTVAIGNNVGMKITSAAFGIGGGSPFYRNVISGNTSNGVSVEAGSTLVTIEGNYIGTSSAGDGVIGNGGNGVLITNASSIVVGGSTTASRNIIAGNAGYGVYAVSSAHDVLITGNSIGTDATGTSTFGNGQGGVLVEAAQNTTIGDATVAEARNVIRFNTGDGVLVKGSGSTGTKILRNAINANSALAIDLGNDGIDATNATNPTSGFTQNAPVISAASNIGGAATVIGRLFAKPSTTFSIDLYSNTVCTSTRRDAQTYLVSVSATTDSDGNATFTLTPSGVASGTGFSAIATGTQSSEVSACYLPVVGSLTTLSFASSTFTVTAGASVANIVLIRSSGTNDAASVRIATADDTGLTAGVDYVSVKQAIVFAAGEIQKTVPITLLTSATGKVKILASEVQGAMPVTDFSASLVVQPPSVGQLALSAATYEAAIADGHVDIVVTRAVEFGDAVSATVTTTDGTALAGVDYTTTSTTVYFGEEDGVAKHVLIPLRATTTFNSDATFNVKLTSSAPVVLADAVVTILRPHPGVVAFDAVSYSSTTADTQVVVHVLRTGEGVGEIVAHVRSNAELSASAGFEPVDATVTFADGDLESKDVTIVLDAPSADAVIALELSTLDAVVGANAVAFVNIVAADLPSSPATPDVPATPDAPSDSVTRNDGGCTQVGGNAWALNGCVMLALAMSLVRRFRRSKPVSMSRIG